MKRNKKKRPHYDDGFKRDTVNLHIKSGKTIHQFAAEMGISDYYKWLKKKPSKREKDEKEVLAEIEAIFFEHKKRYARMECRQSHEDGNGHPSVSTLSGEDQRLDLMY